MTQLHDKLHSAAGADNDMLPMGLLPTFRDSLPRFFLLTWSLHAQSTGELWIEPDKDILYAKPSASECVGLFVENHEPQIEQRIEQQMRTPIDFLLARVEFDLDLVDTHALIKP